MILYIVVLKDNKEPEKIVKLCENFPDAKKYIADEYYSDMLHEEWTSRDEFESGNTSRRVVWKDDAGFSIAIHQVKLPLKVIIDEN